MNIFNSLQARLVITMGIGVTAVWIAATIVSGNILHREMDKVLDSALQETAQRILPLAISDILNREQLGRAHRPTVLEEHNEHFTYIVSNAEGRVLLTSHAVDTSVFPSFVGTGFESTSTHRIYYETTVRDANVNCKQLFVFVFVLMFSCSCSCQERGICSVTETEIRFIIEVPVEL